MRVGRLRPSASVQQSIGWPGSLSWSTLWGATGLTKQRKAISRAVSGVQQAENEQSWSQS